MLEVILIEFKLDSSYEVFKVISPHGDIQGDLHEFSITDQGTALMTIYDTKQIDLSAVGGKANGWIYDSSFQELDIETGRLIFSWSASEHYEVDETYAPIGGTGGSESKAFDFFHINSIDKDPAGNYYISSRYMHTITCISPSGDIIWILGGKRNSFDDLSAGAATNFSWQHHANWHPDDVITIFDNGAYDAKIFTAEYSRGLSIALDLDNMTATLEKSLVNPSKILSHSQGSVQILPSGNFFVGWGHSAAYTEYSPDGEVLCDVHFGALMYYDYGWIKSYRAFKGGWVGRPNTSPDIAMYLDTKEVYASWNGHTDVAFWRLQESDSPLNDDDGFFDVETVVKEGFEVRFRLNHLKNGHTLNYLRVAALNADKEVLGYTKSVDRRHGQVVSPLLAVTSQWRHALTSTFLNR